MERIHNDASMLADMNTAFKDKYGLFEIPTPGEAADFVKQHGLEDEDDDYEDDNIDLSLEDELNKPELFGEL